MSKRMQSAWITVAALAASSWTIGAAEARSSDRSHEASGSRACLTSAARAILSRVEQKFGRMQIVSTCRPGARIAGTRHISRHASGNAIDFNAGARKGAVVRWLAANHRGGGTMTYARMDHIHVDVGRHFVSLSGRRTRVASRVKWSNRMSLGRRAQSDLHYDATERDEERHRRAEGLRDGARGISEPAG